MTHLRYWAAMLGSGLCGALIAIDRFAFAPRHAVWIAFGLAIAAAVLALGAFALALARESYLFSGLSALAALVAGWTIIESRVFATPTALWVAFAAGLVLLSVALRALAAHETTVEHVVHTLAPAPAAAAPTPATPMRDSASGRRLATPTVGGAMRAWIHWLAHTGLALAGGFVVLESFAFSVGAHHHAVRWLAFGVGIAASCLALAATVERGAVAGAAEASEGSRSRRLLSVAVSALASGVAVAMIVTMAALSGSSVRWVAFALGCGLAGVALLGLTVHELSSERVRHKLEIAQAEPAPAPQAVSTPRAA